MALVALWRPWYDLDLHDAFSRLVQGGQGTSAPGLDEFTRAIAAAIPASVSASGWQATKGADVALCVGAVAVLALVLGAAGAFGAAVRVDGPTAGRWIALLGVAGAALCGYHVVHRPLSNDLVHPAGGLWMALGGCGLAIVGGLLSSRPSAPGPSAAAPSFAEPVLTPAADPAGSVPPPGRF
jgi:hypothetical protein